jgi:hypothetical protein
LTCLLWQSRTGKRFKPKVLFWPRSEHFYDLVLTIFFRTTATSSFQRSFCGSTLGWLVRPVWVIAFLTTRLQDSLPMPVYRFWFYNNRETSVIKMEVFPLAVLFLAQLDPVSGWNGDHCLFCTRSSPVSGKANQFF